MRKLLAVVAAATLLMAACGGDDGGGGSGGGSPDETLREAVENLSEGGRTLTFSLNSDAESLSALAEGSLTEEDAGKILDSSLTISTNGADDPAEAQLAVAATIAGSTDVEFRLVDEVVYLRVDVPSLLELAPGPGAQAAAQSQIDALVQQANAQGLNWVEPGVNGEWLAFTGITQLLEQFGGAAAASPTAEQQAVLDKFAAALTDSASVTSEGSDDAGEHLVASVEFKDLYDNFVELASEFGQGAPMDLPPESEVPEGELTLDVWVDDGELTQAELDFLQLAELGDEEIPEGVESLGLRVVLEPFEADVEAPSDATEVDLTQLLQTFAGGALGGAGGTGSGGSSTDAFCDQLKTQPKEVQKQFSAQCPNL